MTGTFSGPSPWPPPSVPPIAARGRAEAGATGRAWWIVIGSILAVGMLAWGSFNLVGLLAHEEHTVVETFDAAGLSAIAIDNGEGSIRVQATDTDVITVTTRLSEGLNEPESVARIDGDRLLLDGGCDGPPIADVWCSVSYRVEVPRRLAVVAEASHGSVTVTGVSGPVELRASHGSVTAEAITSPSVTASTSHGSVRVEMGALPQSVDLRSSSGSVTLVLPDLPGAFAVDASTEHGSENVDIRTDPASERTIRLRTSHGSVTARYFGR